MKRTRSFGPTDADPGTPWGRFVWGKPGVQNNRSRGARELTERLKIVWGGIYLMFRTASPQAHWCFSAPFLPLERHPSCLGGSQTSEQGRVGNAFTVPTSEAQGDHPQDNEPTAFGER